MLLQEGGQGQYHLGNLTQHMETAPRLVTITPNKSRSHHNRHFGPIHHLPSAGRSLPTYSAQADGENELEMVLQDSNLALSQRKILVT